MRLFLLLILSVVAVGCASEHEAGCVQIKRYSKAGLVALRAAAEACVVAHRPPDQSALVDQLRKVNFRNELRNAGPRQCDLVASIDASIDQQPMNARFDCTIDVPVLESCNTTSRSNVDVANCTESAVAVRPAG